MAALTRHRVIGDHGSIPWHLSADMVRFREVTMGHVLVMGRRTYESIGRPLPGRTTVVVTRQRDWPPGADRPPALLVAPDLAGALRQAAAVGGEVFVQGGAGVYAEALPLAERMLLTWVDADPPGDTLFPDVDWAQWEEVDREPFDGGVWSTYLRR